jgi:FAD/FMN-containing dehydrogenase
MKDVGAWGTRGGEWEIMAGLKAEFDPAGILSPGRLGL